MVKTGAALSPSLMQPPHALARRHAHALRVMPLRACPRDRQGLLAVLSPAVRGHRARMTGA
jgi:hypothetical protein